jgi:LDH2 family malate/lactate/ureidoglycolate dehydrogenase
VAYEIGKEDLVELYPLSTLEKFSVDFLLALGANEDEAAIITDGLMTASLWWHPGQGQGLEKFFRFHRQIRNGGIVPNAAMDWVSEGPAYALLDAAKGFGYVSAHRAMAKAVEKAKVTGIAMVGVRHSNHFGIAGYHALHAARHGLIGWSFTNAKAEMAPWGSAKVVLGTNPWGIAIPRRDNHAIVLDMALTMSGKGMMRWYLNEGKPMPDSWALTPSGEKTTDPAAAMEGPLLPIGEYKGYGLSLITDVLSGVMTGSLFGLNVFQDESNHDVGHVMLAIDPGAFLPRDQVDARLEQLILEVKSAPPIDSARPVILPGEVEFGRMDERHANGVPLSRETVDGLRDLSRQLNVEFPL